MQHTTNVCIFLSPLQFSFSFSNNISTLSVPNVFPHLLYLPFNPVFALFLQIILSQYSMSPLLRLHLPLCCNSGCQCVTFKTNDDNTTRLIKQNLCGSSILFAHKYEQLCQNCSFYINIASKPQKQREMWTLKTGKHVQTCLKKACWICIDKQSWFTYKH